ncbi:hypothetical protein PGB28_06675 [Primorskyibacter aestuariivivens]|nr:hypothetical protein [Primorskyibacter aestuariivivens]MDA7428135.1 hypothetical protein [Primorskyibacter aestuariivivens]
MKRSLVLLVSLWLFACSAPQTTAPRPDKVNDLAWAIQSLGRNISPQEAARAAQVAYSESARLAVLYEIEDHPLVHNTKVNLGIKPRGLCYHWADDLEKRLKQEGFETLSLHRAVANFDRIRLEHSTVIISARGDGMYEGIVLDPWRKGGDLTWVPTLEDPRYDWIPREEVFRIRRERRARESR